MGVVAPPPAWLPTPDDVAALLHARTKDSNGDELGVWTPDTRPTLVEVERLCAMVGGLYPECMGALDEASWPAAQHALTLRVACLVELGYWPEQVPEERSPFAQMLELFNQIMVDLCPGDVAGGGGGSGGAGAAAPMPVWWFPLPGPVGAPCGVPYWDPTIEAWRFWIAASGVLAYEGLQLWVRPGEQLWLRHLGVTAEPVRA